MNPKYIKKLKRDDVIVRYIPVCDESYIGRLHGKFVKCKTGSPFKMEGKKHMLSLLFFSCDIKAGEMSFFSSLPDNQIYCDLTLPLVFAEKEFEELRANKELRDKFFEKFPTFPISDFALTYSMRVCWQQTKSELMRLFRMKKPPIIDFSAITVVPPDEE
jgi:hypothetical protein